MKKAFLDEQTKKVIENKLFHHVYQPLYFLSDWSLLGYEAFLRSQYFVAPELLFQNAERLDKLYELDILSLFKAVVSYTPKNRALQTSVFVNIFPSTLLHPDFHCFVDGLLSDYAVSKGEIVLEINESQEINDVKSMRNMLSFLRQNGFQIALDDVGKGSASLKSLVEFEPDFIKLDRYFSIDLSVCLRKQRLIELLVGYCKDDAYLILEGIEKSEDLAIAKLLGVDIGQGYLLGKPERFS